MKKHWTAEETEIAKQMLADGANDAAFRARLDRSKEAALARLDRVTYGAAAVGRKPTYTVASGRAAVSEQAYADAARRLLAPRSITALLMGDPGEGFSALDRRRSA